jgi:hypothetical protein
VFVTSSRIVLEVDERGSNNLNTLDLRDGMSVVKRVKVVKKAKAKAPPFQESPRAKHAMWVNRSVSWASVGKNQQKWSISVIIARIASLVAVKRLLWHISIDTVSVGTDMESKQQNRWRHRLRHRLRHETQRKVVAKSVVCS